MLHGPGLGVQHPVADSVSFQWYRCADSATARSSQGATAVNYMLTDQDVGKYLCVAVTGPQRVGLQDARLHRP